jgi:hypothetical protein
LYKKVIKMVEYVKGSIHDNWHWCKNCTQYPMYIYQKTSEEPFVGFCEQCKIKEEDGNCQIEEIEGTTSEGQIIRVVSEKDHDVSEETL